MQSAPQLSIIIPTFNSGNHLQDCLDSIRNQSFTNYELLIIDGGSSDNTLEIIETNGHLFREFNFISEKDKGVYDAMNKGIFRSKGEWLYFLGSDDMVMDENVLRDVFEVIDNSAPDILYGNVRLGNSKEIYGGEFGNEKIYEMNIPHQAIFFNRRVFDVVGMFDLEYKSNADWAHNFIWFFNPALLKIYLNLTIARFSETGLSSWYVDSVFRKRKELLFLKHAEKHIDKNLKVRVLKSLAINRRNSHNYFEFFWYASIYFIKSKSMAGWPELMGRRKST